MVLGKCDHRNGPVKKTVKVSFSAEVYVSVRSLGPFLMAVAVGASCVGDYWRLGLPLELIIVVVAVPMMCSSGPYRRGDSSGLLMHTKRVCWRRTD